jgi:hypothetical protein
MAAANHAFIMSYIAAGGFGRHREIGSDRLPDSAARDCEMKDTIGRLDRGKFLFR